MESKGRIWSPATGFRATDIVMLTLLLGAVLYTRYPTLGIITLNPDESQYESKASFLVSTGISPFAAPIGPVYTEALFTWMARIFGPYCMVEVRTLFMLICLTMAVLVYLVVRRCSGRIIAGIAGLTFIGLNPLFEGYSVNREWTSGVCLLTACVLYLLSRKAAEDGPEGDSDGTKPTYDLRLLFLSGALVALGVWFKEQMAYLVPTIAVAVAIEGAVSRQWRTAALAIASYAGGGIAMTAVCIAPLAWNGTFLEYMDLIRRLAGDYAHSGVTSPESAGGLEVYFDELYRNLAMRRLFLVGYVVAIGSIVTAAIRIGNRHRQYSSETVLRVGVLFALNLLTAIVAVQAGQRFFKHYFLFMLPPTCVLMALGIATLWQLPRERRMFRLLASVAASVLLLDLLFLSPSVAQPPVWYFKESWSLPLWALLPVGAGLVVAGVVAQGSSAKRNSPTNPPKKENKKSSTKKHHRKAMGHRVIAERTAMALALVATGIIAFDLVRLARINVENSQQLSSPEVKRTLNSILPNITRDLQKMSGDEDSLYVWGWLPEIYSTSQLTSGSRLTIASYVMLDANEAAAANPKPEPVFSRVLLDDMLEYRPRFFVDAARVSHTMSDRSIYDLANFPELQKIIKEHYAEVATVDQCVIYERKDDTSKPE